MAQLDPSIFMTTRQKSPLEYLQEMAAQDQIANQGQLQRLQLLGQQRAFDDAEQARQVRSRGMAAIQSLGGNATNEQRIGALRSVGDYGTADALEKSDLERQKVGASVAKDQADAEKTQLANLHAKVDRHLQGLAMVADPSTAAAWLSEGVRSGVMDMGKATQQANAVRAMTPQQFADWKAQQMQGGMSIKDQIEQTWKAREFGLKELAQAEAGRHNKAQEGLTARGQNLSDARARESLAENRRQFEFAQANGGKGNVTEGERNASGYALRMQEATKLLDQYESTGKPTYTTKAVGAIPLVGGVAQRNVMSPDQQSYRQAQEDWVRAKLRKESGAVIGKEEMEAEIATYFPQPGDTDQVIAQKRASRDVANQAMNNSAGRAAPKPSPKAEAQRKVVRTGKDASGRKVVQYDDGTIDYAP